MGPNVRVDSRGTKENCKRSPNRALKRSCEQQESTATSPQPKRARDCALQACALQPLVLSQLRDAVAASRHACRDKPPLVASSRAASRKRSGQPADAGSETEAPLKRVCQFPCLQPHHVQLDSCETAEGLEKSFDLPLKFTSVNAHSMRPREHQRRSPDRHTRILTQATQLLMTAQQQRQQGDDAEEAQAQAAPATQDALEQDKEWGRMFALLELGPKRQAGRAAPAGGLGSSAAGTAVAGSTGPATPMQPTSGSAAAAGATAAAEAPGTPTKDQQSDTRRPAGSFLRSEFMRVCQMRSGATQ